MPFGKKARYCRAYEFGCLPPTEGEDDAIEQMRGRLKLWNQLVELEHRYSEQCKALIATFVSSEDETERKKQRKAAFQRDDVKATLKEWDKQEYEEARTLWLASGLYWVNHEEVKMAWQQARRKPGTLRFQSWRLAHGKVSVRWQNGLPVDEAFAGENTLLRLMPVSPEAYTSPIRSTRRKLSRSTVSIRVASEARKPVWLTLPCVLHRPLPNGSLIRSASVIRKRIATHFHWKLILIVEAEREVTSAVGPTIGIDIGWRRLPNALRVCCWHDSQGNTGELTLDEYWLIRMAKVEDLRSIRDKCFNETKAALASWLDKAQGIPEAFAQASRYLRLWRRSSRLSALVRHWREGRFTGDESIFEILESWRKREKHLWEYEANLRDKLLAQRREQYRIFAAWLVKSYGTVKVEDFDLAAVARVKGKGKGAELAPAARHYRQWASMSTLRLAIKNACDREGVAFEKVDGAYSTQECHICGVVAAFDAAATLVPTCPACGVICDQDVRAAINISQRAPVLAII